MPARSRAQLRKMAAKYRRGEITLEEWRRWKDVDASDLPERVSKKKPRRKGRGKRSPHSKNRES